MGKPSKKNKQKLPQKVQIMSLRDRKPKIEQKKEELYEDNIENDEVNQDSQKLNKGQNRKRPTNNAAEKKYLAWCKPRRLIFYFHAYTLTTFYLLKNNIKSRQGSVEVPEEAQAKKIQIYEFIKNEKEGLTQTAIQKLYEQAIKFIKKDNFPTLNEIELINFQEQFTGQYTPNSLQNGFYEYRKHKLQIEKAKLKQNERFKIKLEVLKAFVIAFLETNNLLNKKLLNYVNKYWKFIQELVKNQKYQEVLIQQTGIERDEQLIEDQFAEMMSMSQQQILQDQQIYGQLQQIEEEKVNMLEDFNIGRQNKQAFQQIHIMQEELNMINEQNEKKNQKKANNQNQNSKIKVPLNIDSLFSLQSENEFLHHESDQIYEQGEEQNLSQQDEDQDDLVNNPFNVTGNNKNKQKVDKNTNRRTRLAKNKPIQKNKMKNQLKKLKTTQNKIQKGKQKNKKDSQIKVQEEKLSNENGKEQKRGKNKNPPRKRKRVQIDIVLQEMNDSTCCAFNLANYIWHVFNDVNEELYELTIE